MVESLNRSYRKAVKTKGLFPSQNAVFKVLYLATKNAAKKWTMPLRDWRMALNQFLIMFPDRVPSNLQID